MSYGSIVILTGGIILAAVLLAPMWWIDADEARYRRKRRLSALAAVLGFAGFAILYFYADRIDNPPLAEPPPRVTGETIEAEMIVPTSAPPHARSTPRGVRVEASGFGTILDAPPTQYEPAPGAETEAPPLRGVRPGDPPVAPAIAHLIRILPRVRPWDPSRSSLVLVGQEPPIVTGTLVLRDGCFRLEAPGEPLVLLPIDTRAVVDEAGYLTLSPPGTARAMAGRVGEPIWWTGPTMEVTNPAVTAPLREVCGAGRIVRITGTGSDAVRQSQRDASTALQISSMYGVPYEDARRQVAACQADADRQRARLRQRFGPRASEWPLELVPGPCHPAPPPPIASATDCPPGTRFQGGLCRDSEGYIVPLVPRP